VWPESASQWRTQCRPVLVSATISFTSPSLIDAKFHSNSSRGVCLFPARILCIYASILFLSFSATSAIRSKSFSRLPYPHGVWLHLVTASTSAMPALWLSLPFMSMTSTGPTLVTPDQLSKCRQLLATTVILAFNLQGYLSDIKLQQTSSKDLANGLPCRRNRRRQAPPVVQTLVRSSKRLAPFRRNSQFLYS
jgi:hypothetical protein